MQCFCKTIQRCSWTHHEGKQSGGTAPLFLNHGTRWMERSASRSGRLTPGERPLQYPLNISLGGVPEPVWMFCRREKSPRIRTLHRSAHSLVARPTKLPDLLVQYFYVLKRELQQSFYIFMLSLITFYLQQFFTPTWNPIPSCTQPSELNVQHWCAMLQIHFTHQQFCLSCAVVLGQLHSQFMVQHSHHTQFSEPDHTILADVMIAKI